VSFAVLGSAETCTGDPARRTGNEFVYSILDRGHEVVAVAATRRGYARSSLMGVREGDIFDPDFVRSLLRDADVLNDP
jgi:putative NADH-flavin reductase